MGGDVQKTEYFPVGRQKIRNILGRGKFYGLECGFLGEGTQILQNIFGGGGPNCMGLKVQKTEHFRGENQKLYFRGWGTKFYGQECAKNRAFYGGNQILQNI